MKVKTAASKSDTSVFGPQQTSNKTEYLTNRMESCSTLRQSWENIATSVLTDHGIVSSSDFDLL